MPNKEEEELEEQIPEEERQQKPPADLGGYGRQAYQIGKGLKNSLGKKAAGKATGKLAGNAAGKAVGAGIGKAAGAGIGTAVGGPIGTALGFIAGKLVEKFGPKAIKWAFYILLIIFLLFVGGAVAAWGMLGGGEYLGSRAHIQAKESSINKALAYTGDPVKLRQLIADEGDQLKNDLETIKKSIDSINDKDLPRDKKQEAKKKIDEAIVLIDQAKQLLSGTSEGLSKQAEENATKLAAILKELRSVINMVNVHGDFFLPLGSLTCNATHNKSPHTAGAGGHGWFINSGQANGSALDYYQPADSPIYAITDGVIYKIGWHKRWKNYVLYFRSSDGRYEAAYAHVTKEVGEGQQVARGEAIGRLMKGAMEHPHLHFELFIDGKAIKEKVQLPYFCGGTQ